MSGRLYQLRVAHDARILFSRVWHDPFAENETTVYAETIDILSDDTVAVYKFSFDVPGQISEHNTSADAHNDIRLLIGGLEERLDAGKSITNLYQSHESKESGGENIFTFVDDNDNGYDFVVRNGEKGESGVWIGEEEPTEGYDVWINPTGEDVESIGKSAYEIALDHGFEGSEEEWLESLVGKDYVLTKADKTEIADMAAALVDTSGFVAKYQDPSNVGKILVVGTDGNLTLTDMPEGGASGDVIGTLDGSYNILLSGNIPVGTYTLSFVNEDGTYSGAGALEVISTPKPEVAINWITNSINADGTPFVGANGESGYKTGYRLSLSSGGETAADGYECTGFIPAKLNDVIRVKNIDLTSENSTNIVVYDSDKQPTKGTATQYGCSLYALFITKGTDEGNGVYSAKLASTIHASFTEDVAYIRIGSKSITADSVLTVNQEIV
jgi:hypothetical protein